MEIEQKFLFKEYHVPGKVNLFANLVEEFVGMVLWKIAKKNTRNAMVIKFII